MIYCEANLKMNLKYVLISPLLVLFFVLTKAEVWANDYIGKSAEATFINNNIEPINSNLETDHDLDLGSAKNLYIEDDSSLFSNFEVNNSSSSFLLTQSSETVYDISPVQLFLPKPINIETTDILPVGTVSINYGIHNFSTGSQGVGTGLQVYRLSVEAGITERLQLGLTYSYFDDQISDRINNQPTDLVFVSFAPTAKYQLIKKPQYSLAVTGSLERVGVGGANGLFTDINTNELEGEDILAATLQFPFIFEYNDRVKFHGVGGLAIFPSTINNGNDFYGTFFSLGGGISARLSERFAVSGDITYPIGSGGNSVDSRGNIVKNPVWSAAVNYLHSPAIGFDLYLTNALGVTPASKLLTFIPDGKQVAVGFNVRYSPELFGKNYRANFYQQPLEPLSPRDKQLLFDGFISNTAETLRRGMFFVNGHLSAGRGLKVGYGLSDDVQLELLTQRIATTDASQPINFSSETGLATKVRFLNQNQGDPFSFSVRGAFQGSFSFQTPVTYQANDKLALFVNPRGGFFGNNKIFGISLGTNYEIVPGLQLIGEVTPMVSSDPLIWAVGGRYMFAEHNFGVGLYGTNAAGVQDIGSMVRRRNNDVSIGFNLLWLFGK